MRVTVTVFNYVCQQCGKQMRKARTTYLCQRCGKYLCKKHEKGNMCPQCLTNTDIWIMDERTKRIKQRRRKFWGIMFLLLLPSILFFYLTSIGVLDMSEMSVYLPLLFFLIPIIIPLPVLFHWIATPMKKAIITREVLKEQNDIPFLEFFNINYGAGYGGTQFSVNTQQMGKIGPKLMYIINAYGINQLMASLVIYFRLHGVTDNNVIQTKVMQLFTAAGIDLQSLMSA